MPKFIAIVPEDKPAYLKIDTAHGEHFSAEEALVWMMNELRVHLGSIDTRLQNIEVELGQIANGVS